MKTTQRTTGVGWVVLLLLLVPVTLVMARPATQGGLENPSDPRPPASLSPGVHTLDQITHNKGNIVTTVDNFGYIGGYQYYGYPSGEWPRNSGHDYIGEIRYWMGAVTPGGDTLVANTYDDFEATPMPINGDDQYRMYLSTDTTRYFNYDLSDTIGLGDGNPAFGWRVWDPTDVAYELNQVWNPLAADFSPGGPTSLQESHYRFNDAAEGTPLLGLELTQTIMQWNYCYNENFLFVVLEITNTSNEDYSEFAFGLYIDIDVGGPDGSGENGRLNDMVAFDVGENLAWNYDIKGRDPGWNAKTGVMGTKILEMPDGLGMTSFRTDDWAIVTSITDAGMFELINSTQFDESLPPTDQFYIQSTRGIDLTAGKTVRCVFALVAGNDEADFRANASMAQNLYDNNFVGPQPPVTPTLIARSGEGEVLLNWGDTSEVTIDPLSGEADFVGYKLYRSNNQGRTWGEVDAYNSNSCLNVDYDRIAEFSVSYPGDPIAHSYIDTGLYDGVEYWYCLAAYDRGDAVAGVEVLQSGFGIAGEVSNVVAATPSAAPAGYFDAASSVKHTYSGPDSPSQGSVVPIVFDDGAVEGSEYKVVFEDLPDNEATVWHLINVTTGDTLLFDQTEMSDDPDLFEVIEGIKVVVTDGDLEPNEHGQTEFSGAEITMGLSVLGPSVVWLLENDDYVWGHAPFRNHYEIRYTGDSTRATWVWDWYDGLDLVIYWVPFEVWNTTTNQRVSLSTGDYWGTEPWDNTMPLAIVDWPYDSEASVTDFAFPYYYSWALQLDTATFNPAVGDVYSIEGAPVNGPEDVFLFKPDGISASVAANSLEDIRVVPNPYFGRYSALVETVNHPTQITFNRIPADCTIRIYTLVGDLVKTLRHTSGDGSEDWNLQSENGRQVSSGMYIFHVESEFGEHLGRFAIIK